MTDQLTDAEYDDLAEAQHELLATRTRAELQHAWLALTEDQRRHLRPSDVLAAHARTVLDGSLA